MKFFIFEKWNKGTLKYNELKHTAGTMYVTSTKNTNKGEAIIQYLTKNYSSSLIYKGGELKNGKGEIVFKVGDESANMGDYRIEVLSEEELQDKKNISYLWSFDNE